MIPRPDFPASRLGGRFTVFVFWLGILLSVLALGFELATHACAGTFFDPIPTWGHAVLIALVPISLYLVWSAAARLSGKLWQVAAFAHALALPPLVLYLLALGFLTPMAIMYVPFVMVFALAGIGHGGGLLILLVLATLGPLAALISWLVGFHRLCRYGCGDDREFVARWKRLRRGGYLAGILLIAALELPLVWTYSALSKAMSSDTDLAAREKPLATLRTFASKDLLLQMCYASRAEETPGHFGPVAHIFNSSGSGRIPIPAGPLETRPFPLDKTREVYFRVTGRVFSDDPPPRHQEMSLMGNTLRSDGTRGVLQWDGERGGGDVGARLIGMSLASSRMDWHLEKDSGLAYGEWTVEFRNEQAGPQEARCQILLPHGGCVSRLTLWINGEPREAAFGPKKKVTEAYRQVAVVQQRDPVLVNMVGPDRIMMQCFPVPANGTMKMRLGITAPLAAGKDLRLSMPLIIERNFSVPPALRHALWLQGNAPLALADGTTGAAKEGTGIWSLQQDVAHSRISSFQVGITGEPAVKVWSQDPFARSGESPVVLRERTTDTTQRPARVVVVVDASVQLRPMAPQIRRAIAELAQQVPVTVALTTDGEPRTLATSSLESKMSDAEFQGGRDSEPALREAWKLAGGATILWLHGPQPLKFSGASGLEQWMERSQDGTRLIAISLVHGPNRLLEALYQHSSVQAGPRFDGTADGLSQVMLAASAQGNLPSFTWTRLAEAPTDAVKVSDQLVRLGVFEEVLAAFKGQNQVPDAQAQRAARYHLVTPYSGAVVLETQEQYARAGLAPGDPNASPSIPSGVPEPSRALMLVFGIACLLLRRRRAS